MVGLGGIGQRHVRNLRTLSGLDIDISACRSRGLTGVLTDDLKIDPHGHLEEKYNIRVFKNLDQALAAGPDAVFVCNPSSLHIPVASAAAKAGCHLFIEKPLSHSDEGVDELIRLTGNQNLIALVGFQMRFHPCLRRLDSLLSEHVVGRLTAVRVEVGEYLPGFHTFEDYRHMYAARQDLGGGVILSQIHELDYVYWLFGLPRRVFALGGHLSSLEIDVEDTASILMECVVDGQPLPVHVHQDFIQRPPSRTCEVIGDAGKVLIDFHAMTVHVFGDRGELVERGVFEGFERNQLFLDELRHFMACLQGLEKPVVTLQDGRQSLKIALAARDSLRTGKVVELR